MLDKNRGGGNKIFTPCTCGRKLRDKKDYIRITEYIKKYTDPISKELKPSSFTMIACTRKGCKGRRRARYKFIDSLPQILYNVWWEMKNSE